MVPPTEARARERAPKSDSLPLEPHEPRFERGHDVLFHHICRKFRHEVGDSAESGADGLDLARRVLSRVFDVGGVDDELDAEEAIPTASAEEFARWALGPRQQGARLAVRTEAAFVADSRADGTGLREARKRWRGGSAVRPARDALRPPVPTLAECDPLPPMEDDGVLPVHDPLEVEEGSVRKRANNFLKNWHRRTLCLDAPTHTATFYTDARKRKFNRQVFLKTVRDIGRCDGGSKPHCFQVTSGDREMVCACDSEAEADHWVKRIATYALMDALASRDGVDRATFLLDRGASPDASPGHGGRLPFAAQALTAGLTDVCALLLRRGADPSPLARWQLHRSGYLSLPSVLSVLQEAAAGLEVTADDAYAMTLLHTAVVMGDLGAARTVLDHCSDDHVQCRTAAGDSALALALKSRHEDAKAIAELLLPRSDAQQRDSRGSFPLHLTLRRGWAGLARACLALTAADSLAAVDSLGQPALHIAQYAAMDDVAREIAEKATHGQGASEDGEEGGAVQGGARLPLEAVDRDLGDSALSLALRRRDEPMASALVALGADPQHRPASWQAAALEGSAGRDTCLQAAIKLGLRTLALAMIERGVSGTVLCHDGSGTSTLHVALSSGQFEVAACAARAAVRGAASPPGDDEAGLEVQRLFASRNSEGETPAQAALAQGQVELALILLDLAAEVGVELEHGAAACDTLGCSLLHALVYTTAAGAPELRGADKRLGGPVPGGADRSAGAVEGGNEEEDRKEQGDDGDNESGEKDDDAGGHEEWKEEAKEGVESEDEEKQGNEADQRAEGNTPAQHQRQHGPRHEGQGRGHEADSSVPASELPAPLPPAALYSPIAPHTRRDVAAPLLPSVAALLVDQGAVAEAGTADEAQRTPLHVALSLGDPARRVLAALLQRAGPEGAALSTADAAGEVLLQQAVRTGATDVVAALCRSGSPVDAVDAAGNGPIHSALWLRDPATRGATLQELLLAGAYTGDWDSEGRAPVHLAVLRSDVDSLESLLAAGATPDARTEGGDTPASIAVQRAEVECLRVLVSHGADLRLRLPRARSSLFHLAAHVAELIGDDPDHPLVDVDGETEDATLAPAALEEHPVVRYLPLGASARARFSVVAAALVQREKECLVHGANADATGVTRADARSLLHACAQRGGQVIDGVLPSPRLRRGPPPQSRMRRDDVDGGIEKEEEQDGGKEQEQEQEDDDEEAEETKESDEKEGGEEEGEESVDGTGASQPSSNSVKGTENATPPKRTPSWMREDYRTEVAPTSRFASAPQLRAPLRVEVADKALAAARRWGGIEHDSASTSASASASVGQRLSGFSAGHTSATARHADSASLPHTSAVATGRWQSRTPAKQMRSMSARGPPASSAGATLRPGQALVSPQGSSSSASPLPHSPARVASEARQAAAGRLTPPVPVREDEETEGGYTSHSDREGDGPMQGEGGNSSGDAQLPVRGDVDAATLRARRGVPQWLEHSSPVAEGEEEGATTESDREGFAALRAHSLPSLGVIGAPPVPKAPPRRQSNSPLLGPNGPTRNDSRFRTWESAGPGGRLRRGSFPAVGSAVVGPSDALAVAEAEARTLAEEWLLTPAGEAFLAHSAKEERQRGVSERMAFESARGKFLQQAVEDAMGRPTTTRRTSKDHPLARRHRPSASFAL